MVTEFGMSSKLGAVKYGSENTATRSSDVPCTSRTTPPTVPAELNGHRIWNELQAGRGQIRLRKHGDPFLGRTMHQTMGLPGVPGPPLPPVGSPALPAVPVAACGSVGILSDWRWRGRGNHGAAGSAGPSVTAGGVTGAAGSAGRGLWLSRHPAPNSRAAPPAPPAPPTDTRDRGVSTGPAGTSDTRSTPRARRPPAPNSRAAPPAPPAPPTDTRDRGVSTGPAGTSDHAHAMTASRAPTSSPSLLARTMREQLAAAGRAGGVDYIRSAKPHAHAMTASRAPTSSPSLLARTMREQLAAAGRAGRDGRRPGSIQGPESLYFWHSTRRRRSLGRGPQRRKPKPASYRPATAGDLDPSKGQKVFISGIRPGAGGRWVVGRSAPNAGLLGNRD